MSTKPNTGQVEKVVRPNLDDIFHYLYVKLYYISDFSGESAPVSAPGFCLILAQSE